MLTARLGGIDKDSTMMSTTFQTEGAKIYTFPRRVRETTEGIRRGDHTVTAFQPRAHAAIECGSSWYHEAAVQSERTVKP